VYFNIVEERNLCNASDTSADSAGKEQREPREQDRYEYPLMEQLQRVSFKMRTSGGVDRVAPLGPKKSPPLHRFDNFLLELLN
jgi:hypothetical protein